MVNLSIVLPTTIATIMPIVLIRTSPMHFHTSAEKFSPGATRQQEEKRKTQKIAVSFFWVLVIQMTYKGSDPFATPIRPQNNPQTHQNSNLARAEIGLT